jgi:hypothetical protein
VFDPSRAANGRRGAPDVRSARAPGADGANSHSRITLKRATPPSTLAEATTADSINAVGLSTTVCSSTSTADP